MLQEFPVSALILVASASDDHTAEQFAESLRASTRLDVQIITDHTADFDLAQVADPGTSVIIPLLSPSSAFSDTMQHICVSARQNGCRIYPIVIRPLDHVPWFLQELPLIDATRDHAQAAENIRSIFDSHTVERTFGTGRDAYLQRATLKSANTIAAYRRAIELFLDFLDDRSQRGRLPIHGRVAVAPDDTPLSALSAEDAPILLHFAEWLLSESSGARGDKRPYKVTTVELRLAGIQNWFQFMDDHGWLPAEFPLAKAKRIVRDELRGRPRRSGPPQPPDHIEELITYFDRQERPPHLNKPNADPDRVRRWDLTRLRNRALLHALAETGGRISEVLSLNIDDFPVRYLDRDEVLRVEVRAKGGHTYQLRFLRALPAIRQYIQARGADLRATARGHAALFVSHDPRYNGARMSRVVAWRVVQRAARALGLKSITPHDFRHWRATQLINAGTPLDVVQDYLGHRSVETTRAYYAHTDPLRVDEAARKIGLLGSDDETDDET